MIWTRREKPRHRIGDTRIRKRFAWLPTELNYPAKSTVWLESYYSLEEWAPLIIYPAEWLERATSTVEEYFECCRKIDRQYGYGYWETPKFDNQEEFARELNHISFKNRNTNPT